MNAIVVMDQAAGTAGMTLVERPERPGNWPQKPRRPVDDVLQLV